MAAEDESQSKISVNNVVDWNVHNEVQLLLALMGHKPVGVAKYFHMACILDKFSNAVKREDISSKVIWDRLDTMYDMQALEETEALPFPNEVEDFSLPPAQYSNLLNQKKSVKMPPPPAPSPPPEVKKEDSKDSKKETVKDWALKKDLKEPLKKGEDKKVSVKDIKKEVKEETNKKDKKFSKDPPEDRKKEKETSKGKEGIRLPKRASAIRDDEDSSVSSTGSAKKSRDNSDTDDATSTPKRTTNTGANNQSANGKGAKRQTRNSYGKVSDDSGSNKSISPLTVSSPTPTAKRRRQV